MSHQHFLHRCLELAAHGRAKTGINPMVGAVLVRDEKIIGEGFHSEFGKEHAERQLVQKFDQKISSEDSLYVNLEPCCHTNKKTPPCAQLIIEKGIKTVVFGMTDPNPEVSGKGIQFLRENGVTVIGLILPAECARLNRGFVSLQTNKRPWITLKSAQTIDGRFAKPDGSPLKITNAQQDAWSHEFLRARHDAILAGVGTVLRDDPSLTVRSIKNPPHVWRVILDSTLRTPLDAKVVADGTIIVTAPDADASIQKKLKARGVRIVHVPVSKKSFDWPKLWKALTNPQDDFYGISSILVEGGPATWKMFRDAKMVDEEVTLVG
jgi:diaminohydroxyphosphoribosylaminopyrimidine deaminase/5-amino-6-(5-phosphoribosylamino)uracil reductase